MKTSVCLTDAAQGALVVFLNSHSLRSSCVHQHTLTPTPPAVCLRKEKKNKKRRKKGKRRDRRQKKT